MLKTRQELYAKEASELLRVISTYKSLLLEQLYCLFPQKEHIIMTLITNFIKQKRMFMDQSKRYVLASETIDLDNERLKAFWVLLDFFDRVEYHAAGDYPVQLSFFIENELYEVIVILFGQESLICHALACKKEYAAKRIVIVDDANQIGKITIPGICGFCTVSNDGIIQYYKYKK